MQRKSINDKINKVITTKKFDSFMSLFDNPVEKTQTKLIKDKINKKQMLKSLNNINSYSSISKKYDIDIIYNKLSVITNIVELLIVNFNLNELNNFDFTKLSVNEKDDLPVNEKDDLQLNEKDDLPVNEKDDLPVNEKDDLQLNEKDNLPVNEQDDEIKKFIGDRGNIGRRGIYGKNGKLISQKETDVINNLNKINIVLDKILLKIK